MVLRAYAPWNDERPRDSLERDLGRKSNSLICQGGVLPSCRLAFPKPRTAFFASPNAQVILVSNGVIVKSFLTA